MQQFAELAQQLSGEAPTETRLQGQLCQSWSALLRGDSTECVTIAESVARAASDADHAELVVESRALAALGALEGGDTVRALELARRASLMARVESLPQPEFLAHLVLARARRCARQPHLSLRIVRALAEVAPAPWRSWLGWEWLLAGGERELEWGSSATLSLLARVSCAEKTEGEAVRELGALAMRLPQPLARDASVLASCLLEDPSIERSLEERVARWRAGEVELIPEELHGVAFRGERDGSAGPVAKVVARPDAPGVRLLAQAPLPPEYRSVDTHAQRRVETLLSVLGLAGPEGLAEAACFERTYGFAFVPELHAGSFEVLLHRTRSTLGGLGHIERDEGQGPASANRQVRWLRLVLVAPVVVGDPRVSLRTADRVLRLLAARGSASAKDVARDLAISLRAAQGALSELSERQLCDRQKVGRNVAYVVEDTVFSEPSLRLRLDEVLGG